MHVETCTKQFEHRAWERRLVGYSMDSKSFWGYTPEARRARKSRNVINSETPSALPRPDVGGYDEEGFTHDDYDDMVRDVRTYNFNQESRLPVPNPTVADPSVQQMTPPVDTPSDAAPEGVPAPLGGVGPPEPGEGSQPSGSPPSGSAPWDSTTSGRGPSDPALRGGSGRGGSTRGRPTSRVGRDSRVWFTPTQPATRSVPSAPNATTLGELRRLAYVRRLAYALNTKGEFIYVAHEDDSNRVLEYAYVVRTLQSGVSRTMKMPDAELWRSAFKREIKCLQ